MQLNNEGINAPFWLDRIRALTELTDQQALGAAACSAPYSDVREAAARRVTDRDMLGRLAQNETEDWRIRRAAFEALGDTANAVSLTAQWDESERARISAIALVEDQSILVRIACKDTGDDAGLLAFDKLTDPCDIARVAQDSPSRYVRIKAIGKLNEGDPCLANIALNDPYKNARELATEKLCDQPILEKIALNDTFSEVRAAAIRRVTNQQFIWNIFCNDKLVQRAALHALQDQELLAFIALGSSDADCRRAALQRVNDKAVLRTASRDDKDWMVRALAFRLLGEEDWARCTEILNDPNTKQILETIGAMKNRDCLIKILEEAVYPYERVMALETLNDPEIFRQCTGDNFIWQLRCAAYRKLGQTNKAAILVLQNDYDWGRRVNALKELDDETDRVYYTLKEQAPYARAAAAELLTDSCALEAMAVADDNKEVSEAAFRRLIALGYTSRLPILQQQRRDYEEAAEKERIKKAFNGTCSERYDAVKALSDVDTLLYIALNDDELQNEALKRLNDQASLAKVAFAVPNRTIRLCAIQKITDHQTLLKLVNSERDVEILQVAQDRIKALADSDQTLPLQS